MRQHSSVCWRGLFPHQGANTVPSSSDTLPKEGIGMNQTERIRHRAGLALFRAITGRKYKTKSSLWHTQLGRGKWSFPVLCRAVTEEGLRNTQTWDWGRAGDRQANCPPPSQPTCTNHFRRQRPPGSADAHKGHTQLCFPGLMWENHTQRRAPFICNAH